MNSQICSYVSKRTEKKPSIRHGLFCHKIGVILTWLLIFHLTRIVAVYLYEYCVRINVTLIGVMYYNLLVNMY